jgi:pRiA4b ORF-3-like protein
MKCVIKVELVGITDPKVWRRIIVPGQFTFDQLHKAIQAGMGWKESHLFSFSENGIADIFSITSPYDEESGIDARIVDLSKILLDVHNTGFMGDPRKTITYIYDYGDFWEHMLDVEAVIPEDGIKAELMDGAGACPPEDCGGVHGFEDLKKSLRTGKVSEIHGESWMPWLEGCGYKDYDPNVFDVEEGKRRMRKIR